MGYGGKLAQDANLVLSTIKFVDIALLVPTEQFRLYEWIFVSDYFDEYSSSSPRNNMPSHVSLIHSLSLKASGSIESPFKVCNFINHFIISSTLHFK
jgi:hypothetical protein